MLTPAVVLKVPMHTTAVGCSSIYARTLSLWTRTRAAPASETIEAARDAQHTAAVQWSVNDLSPGAMHVAADARCTRHMQGWSARCLFEGCSIRADRVAVLIALDALAVPRKNTSLYVVVQVLQ